MEHTGIPKKIHYIWFGGNPKSELMLRCIDSWHRFFPDYEIIEWNESNYDVTKSPYVRRALEDKKWAFASDYVRFDILYTHGGIYLDTDVELLKPIPDSMLAQQAFTGYESSGYVSPGLIYAAIPGFSLTREILEAYQSIPVPAEGNPTYQTVNTIVTGVLEHHAQLRRNEFQIIDGLALYPSEYFCGYDLDVGEYDIRPETISVHHYAGTWTTETRKTRLQKQLKRILGIPGYRKLLGIKRLFFGISGERRKTR